jgi:hypothetical protein
MWRAHLRALRAGLDIETTRKGLEVVELNLTLLLVKKAARGEMWVSTIASLSTISSLPLKEKRTPEG